MNTSDEATRAIEAAKAAMPELTTWGVGIKDDRREFSGPGVATAIAFLRQCTKTNDPRFSSYGLKHAAERWGKQHGLESYVTNGELIAAAIYLGFKIEKAMDRQNPNVTVAVTVDDVQRLDPNHPWSMKYWKKERAR
jgi:hypothetical protein